MFYTETMQRCRNLIERGAPRLYLQHVGTPEARAEMKKAILASGGMKQTKQKRRQAYATPQDADLFERLYANGKGLTPYRIGKITGKDQSTIRRQLVLRGVYVGGQGIS